MPRGYPNKKKRKKPGPKPGARRSTQPDPWTKAVESLGSALIYHANATREFALAMAAQAEAIREQTKAATNGVSYWLKNPSGGLAGGVALAGDKVEAPPPPPPPEVERSVAGENPDAQTDTP